VRTRRSPDGERAGVTRTRERRAFANELARTPATEPGRPGGHTRPSRRSPDAPRETATPTVAATRVAFACWRRPTEASTARGARRPRVTRYTILGRCGAWRNAGVYHGNVTIIRFVSERYPLYA